MELGAFSISLAVRDLAASRAFYHDLGFEMTGDDTTADNDAGPASFVMVDPDGNQILIDQHR
jgi:catechol 2,3-dioxygenase-like lactoylglutathione lyase family enzyme